MLVNQSVAKHDGALPAKIAVDSAPHPKSASTHVNDAFLTPGATSLEPERTHNLTEAIPSPARSIRSVALSRSHSSVFPPNDVLQSAHIRWRNGAERDPVRLQQARMHLAVAISQRVMTFSEIENLVNAAYPVELGYLMGGSVKITPDRVDVVTTSDGAGMRDDREVVKVVARIAFLNYAIHASHDHIVSDASQPKFPLTHETLERISKELSGLSHDAEGLSDIKSLLNALVITSLGKSDTLVRPRLRELGGISESPEERMGIVLNLGTDMVPCLADTHVDVIDMLRLGARRSFTMSHIVQGEGPAACVYDLDMSAAQRRWYAIHGLVCAAGASAMSEGGFFAPTETIVGRYIAVLHYFGQDIAPVAAYMGFMRGQALRLGLPDSSDSLALTRLLLHARTTDAADKATFLQAWADLKPELKMALEEGLGATGLSREALDGALPAQWQIQPNKLGTDAMCTMIQYAPALFNNAAYTDTKRIVSTKAGYERALTLLAELYREGSQLIERSGLKGSGMLRVDAQQLAETVRDDLTIARPRLFLVERQSRDSGVRLDAISYAGPADLARLETLVEAGSVECRLMQILGELILSDSMAVSDNAERNLLPSAIFRRGPSRGQAAPHIVATGPIDAAFEVTPETRAAFLPIVERFAAPAEEMLGSSRRIGGALPAPTQALLDNFREALASAAQPLGLDSDKRFKTFIGLLDELAEKALPGAPNDCYGLRRMALAAGNGAIKSWQAFTYAKRFQTTAGVDWDFIANPRNWLPERIKIKGDLVAHAFISVLRTSSQLKLRRPEAADVKTPEVVGYMITGGFGSGKTTMLHQTFGFDVHRVGSDALKEHLAVNIDGFLPFDLVHLECSALSYDVVNEVMNHLRGVYLFDTSLARAEDARRPIAAMKGQGMLHIMGLHVPLHISLLRVLGRRVVEHNDPRIPFRDVVTGWQNTVENRRGVCDVIKAHPDGADYELYIANNTGGDYQRAATIKKGEESVLDSVRWDGAVNPLSADVVAALGARSVRHLLADRNDVTEDMAVRLDLKFSGRKLTWDDLNEAEQTVLRGLDPSGAWERSAVIDFRDLPLSIALDVNARRTTPWAGELNP